MIEEFAVPGWVPVLIRLTRRHLRRSTSAGDPREPHAFPTPPESALIGDASLRADRADEFPMETRADARLTETPVVADEPIVTEVLPHDSLIDAATDPPRVGMRSPFNTHALINVAPPAEEADPAPQAAAEGVKMTPVSAIASLAEDASCIKTSSSVEASLPAEAVSLQTSVDSHAGERTLETDVGSVGSPIMTMPVAGTTLAESDSPAVVEPEVDKARGREEMTPVSAPLAGAASVATLEPAGVLTLGIAAVPAITTPFAVAAEVIEPIDDGAVSMSIPMPPIAPVALDDEASNAPVGDSAFDLVQPFADRQPHEAANDTRIPALPLELDTAATMLTSPPELEQESVQENSLVLEPPPVIAAAPELNPALEPKTPPLPESPPATRAAEAAPAEVFRPPEPAKAEPAKPATNSVLAPALQAHYNRIDLDYRRPMPRPKVRGAVIDFHCHLLAARHADAWFEAADHFGIDHFVTMTPLEEAVSLQRRWGHRLRFIAVPRWGDPSPRWVDQWLLRIEAFYNLGSRIVKFHAAPGTMVMRGVRLDHPAYRPLFREVRARKMVIMTHIGDPDTWYNGKYTDTAKFGSRDEHYQMWEGLLEEFRGNPWVGAHLGGNPENLPRLQGLLDRFPDLSLDCSATRWMAREISARRDPAREFFIRNADRILFGSDQVSMDDRGYDFLASRFWVHRKLWETAYIGENPIFDPDLAPEAQPMLRGLALPDSVLQKIYHDNPTRLLTKAGAGFTDARRAIAG